MEQTRPSSQLRLSLLGPPQVMHNQSLLVIQRRKVQALLYYLAVTGELHRRDTLAALFWSENSQQQAHGSLRRNLSELNRLLDAGWIEIGQDTVRLAPRANLWVDVHEFQQLLATCQEHHPLRGGDPEIRAERYIELLSSAVALYQADFLSGFSLVDAPGFDEWQSFQTEELRLAYDSALEQLAEALSLQNRTGEAISYARRRLTLDPLHEAAHRQLMQLYAATGQRNLALQQYQLCANLLQVELEMLPDAETTALYEQVRRGELTAKAAPAIPSSTSTPTHHVPVPTTPLVGRALEVATLADLCRDPTRRLVTILGPGGIGKTHLSLEVAAQLVDEVPQGVFFVRLAQLSDPANIIPEIAAALDLQFQADGRATRDQLFAYLRHRDLLLVLDNFEHLLESVTFIQDLLQNCPQVRLLVTSRERLKLTSETLYTLNHLDFPSSERSPQVQNYGAVKLFIETAQRIRPTEVLQADDLRHVAHICRMVGGMPLGIILAAAWMELLPPAKIAAELRSGFDLLEAEMRDLPERQRNMRGILAFSWQRLTSAERTVFMRLAVFRAGFTFDAAQVVAGASALNLSRLLDKSFIYRMDGDRYDIHELLRQYAEQQLQAAGAYLEAEGAHCRFYLDLLHHCEPRLAGPEQLEAIRQVEDNFENIRAAWQWAVSAREYSLIDRALDGLFRWFWLRRTRQQEALDLLRFAQQLWAPEEGQAAHAVWGRILARLVEQQGPWLLEPLAVRERVEHALAIARAHRDQPEEIFCQWVLGLAKVSEHRGTAQAEDIKSAIDRYEACVAAYRAGGDPFWLAHVLELLGHALRVLDQFDRAVPPLQESLALRQAQADRFSTARSLRELAWVRLKEGVAHETMAAAQAAYALQCELGDQQGIADSQFFLALIQVCCGNWRQAQELIEPVARFADEMNNALYQRWSFRISTIAGCMEENALLLHSATCSFPNRFNRFSTTLMHVIFSMSESAIHFRLNVRKLLALAKTDDEIAVCLVFAGVFLVRSGYPYRAAMIASLAYRHSVIAEGWVGLHPEVRTLQRSLRNALSPTEFEQAWQAGARLEPAAVVAELLHTEGQGETFLSHY